MALSPDAALFALRLLGQRCVTPSVAAELLREVAAGGEYPDQLIALEERLLQREPSLGERAARLSGQPFYVPVDCRGCRARFRVRPEEVGPSAVCPLCGEAIMTAGSLRFAAPFFCEERRAAEEGPVYDLEARGRRFAHFRLMDLLGSGGAGKVYEALNLRTGRTVAVKLLDFQPLEPASEAFRHLRREAHAATMVADEHVVQVFDLGVAEGVPFMEMELVRGDSLREMVRREGLLEAKEACRLCLQALGGLGTVHRARIVHSDIKPQNILIDQEGRARLTDFGLARFLEETTSISVQERVVGSPHFMAPEQWRGEKLTAAADLYAMGLVLYFSLTGRLPYEGETHVALMYKHLHEPILGPGQTLYQVPDQLTQVIRRATEKVPAARFADAEEFVKAIADCGFRNAE
jgi:serine/threonine protein kinase